MKGDYPADEIKRLAELVASDLGASTVDRIHVICAAFRHDHAPLCLALMILVTSAEVEDVVTRVIGRGSATMLPEWSAEAAQMLVALRKNREASSAESDVRVLLREVVGARDEDCLVCLASLGVYWQSVEFELGRPEIPRSSLPPVTQPIPADLDFARPHKANEHVRRLIRSIVRNRARREQDPDPLWVEFEELMVFVLRERCARLDAERDDESQ